MTITPGLQAKKLKPDRNSAQKTNPNPENSSIKRIQPETGTGAFSDRLGSSGTANVP